MDDNGTAETIFTKPASDPNAPATENQTDQENAQSNAVASNISAKGELAYYAAHNREIDPNCPESLIGAPESLGSTKVAPRARE